MCQTIFRTLDEEIGAKASFFNDDANARHLDRISDAGHAASTIFDFSSASVAVQPGYSFLLPQRHTTSKSVYGASKNLEEGDLLITARLYLCRRFARHDARDIGSGQGGQSLPDHAAAINEDRQASTRTSRSVGRQMIAPSSQMKKRIGIALR